jgi:glutamate/tyrosine decarboxylase-like PLP-dependent enzyme
MTSGHSTPGGQEMNVCALYCPLNWATESNMNIRKNSTSKKQLLCRVSITRIN